MKRLTYHGTPYTTIHGITDPIYSDYPIRPIMNKLAEYEDAEEQGLLLRLPCKIGETVYEVETQYWIDEKGCKECLCYFNGGDETFCDYPGDYPACTKIVETTFNLTNIDRIGKTLFLTKEEAEAALKKMQEDEE